MFTAVKFYIIVGKESLIIRRQDNGSEEVIKCRALIPNVPFYYHLFDEENSCFKEIKNMVKKLKIRNVTLFIPDDSMDIEVDKKVFTEMFLLCGVRKVELKSQAALLNLKDEKYISIAKTVRTLVLEYIVDNKSIAKRYYDKDYYDKDEILLAMRKLHSDCEYEAITVYINNINGDMDDFRDIGKLVSLEYIYENIMNFEKRD